MALAVVISPNGIPVSSAPSPYGFPVILATNGYGVPVTPVASGGRAVFDVGGNLFDSGSSVGPNYRMRAQAGSFMFTGEDMTVQAGYFLTAQAGAFALADPGTTKLTPPLPSTTFAFKGADASAVPGNPRPFTIDIGTHTSDRRIIVAVLTQDVGPMTVTVNSVSLTLDVLETVNKFISIFSGIVATGDGPVTVNVLGVSDWTTVGVAVWAATGLTTGKKTTGSGASASHIASCTLNVAGGDYMFAVTSSPSASGSTFAGSTEMPTTIRASTATGPFATTGEWIPIASSHTPMTVAGNNLADYLVVASYG